MYLLYMDFFYHKIKKEPEKQAKKKLGEDLYSLEVNLSIVGANRLNYQVRNVSGCTSVAMFTKQGLS